MVDKEAILRQWENWLKAHNLLTPADPTPPVTKPSTKKKQRPRRVTKALQKAALHVRRTGQFDEGSPALGGRKYHAWPTVVDNIRFHSKKEARRYCELKLLLKAGEIKDLELQPRYLLSVPRFDRCGMRKVGFYVADFRYLDVGTGQLVIEDVKGYDLPFGRWKRKHAEAQYGIQIRLA